VADILGIGGRERQLGLLCTNLPDGWKPFLWSIDGGAYEEPLRDSGVEVRVAGRQHRWDPRLLLDLWETMQRVRPDVVHSWGWMASSAALLPCRCMHVPLIDGSIRNGMAAARRKTLVRVNHRLADLVVANSRAGLKANKIPEPKGRVLHNGFDMARLSVAEEESPGSPGRFKVVMTGRMMRQKDYATFLSAARILDGLEPGRWLFAAVGWGPDGQALAEQNADLVESGSVVFPGGRPEVIGLVRHCDAGVLLTTPKIHAEGLANSLIEYMACGLPVVCCESGGNRELVEDGVSGFVIPAADPYALVQKLLVLRGDPDLARRMGDAARRRVLDDLSVERMVAAAIGIYEEVCCKR
jgi:glycosyltransferase involved in cell wall biosynthesis